MMVQKMAIRIAERVSKPVTPRQMKFAKWEAKVVGKFMKTKK